MAVLADPRRQFPPRDYAEMVTESDVMNAVDAAAFLGVHVETLRKLARRNEIPCFKIGRDWRFRQAALVRWADGQRSKAIRGSVLIVDDDENVCRSLGRLVQQFGCRVRHATHGKIGLSLVQEELPDVVLLDLVMPDMGGAQFLQEVRKVHPSLPVVIVTGYPDSDLVKEAMQFAPLMLLAKPVEPELLGRTVRMAVGDKLARGATR